MNTSPRQQLAPAPFASPGRGEPERASLPFPTPAGGTGSAEASTQRAPLRPAPGRPSAQIRAHLPRGSLDTVSFLLETCLDFCCRDGRPEGSPRPQSLGERYPTGVSCAKLGGPARALRCGRREVVTYRRGAGGAGRGRAHRAVSSREGTRLTGGGCFRKSAVDGQPQERITHPSHFRSPRPRLLGKVALGPLCLPGARASSPLEAGKSGKAECPRPPPPGSVSSPAHGPQRSPDSEGGRGLVCSGSGSWGLARIQASVGPKAFLKPQTRTAGEMPEPHVAPWVLSLPPTLSVSKVGFAHPGLQARAWPQRNAWHRNATQGVSING